MNPTSKRHLLTLGPLVCLAIATLGLTEFWIHNASYDGAPEFASALSVMLKTAAVAFPLLGVALYLLKKQHLAHIEELRKSIEESTREERNYSQSIIEGTEAGTWDWNLQTGKLVLNERWAGIIGYTLQELEPIDLSTWERTAHPDDKKETIKFVEQHMAGTLQYYDHEFRQLHKDGTWRWVNARGKITEWTEAGEPLRMSGTHLDITERKTADLKLNESRRMLQHVLDTIPTRVFWKDTNSVFLGANQLVAQDLDQQTPRDLIGKTDYDFFNAEHAEAFRQDDQAIIQSGIAKLNYQEPQARPDGSIGWLKTSKVPLRNQADEIIGVLGTYEDITEVKKAKEELVQAKEGAEAASKAKDEFLAVMSHEMRTPLNPILGFADMLQQSITSMPEAEYIETIISAANRQLRLIDDILEYMRINSGQIKPSTEKFSLVDLCRLAVNDAQSAAGQLDLSFVNNSKQADAADDFMIESDMMMIRRILDNLLNNACKYTNEGNITVSLLRASSEADTAIIEITDTGIGIAPQNQQQLFGAFNQVDSSYTRKHEGLGLGLAICQKLLTILGGSITVDSALGLGSTFTIQLPVKELKEPATQTARPTRLPSSPQQIVAPCHILIVDDRLDNRLIARHLVESYGCQATEATNGNEAVDLCTQNKFDVILMDLAMPFMDGKEATTLIRSTPNLNQSTPIIAITAEVTPKVQEDCIASGMQHYLSKPITSKKLFEVINDCV